MKNIIFYHPYNLVENPVKGSQLRPKKMKEAFEDLGYQVDLVTGNSLQRKKIFKQIKNNIQEGKEYDFMYAESLNMPIPIADSHHMPIRPLQDYRFFRTLNKYSIPIGFFYRDLYWQGNELKKRMSFHKYIYRKLFHWLEWFGIRATVDCIFLPTKKMQTYLPTHSPEIRIESLYPGCFSVDYDHSKSDFPDTKAEDNRLRLFYVGGVKPPFYDLKPMLKIMNELNNVYLVLCCRKEEWNDCSEYYGEFDFNNIEIIHASSNEIGKFYKQADIFLDVRQPQGYLKTTIPIKIFEAIGYNLPLLLLKGTEYAEFIKNEGGGWVVKDTNMVKEVLKDLDEDRNQILEKVVELQEISRRNTWQARAKKASLILTGKKSSFIEDPVFPEN